MKALNLYGIKDLRYEETKNPSIENPFEVIIKVKAVGICGSDIHRFAQLGPYIPGMTWGHEFSGVVVEAGSEVENVKIGDRVTACPALYCGKCESCKKGEFARCDALTVIGARHPGAFAEYVKVPSENVVKIPDEVTYDMAAVIEPASVVVHGLYKTGMQPGDDIAILGCGTIGLLAIQWAKIFGAKNIFAFDIDDKKLEIAKSMGANHIINSLKDEPYKQLEALTDGRMADIVVESAGTTITSAQAFSLGKKGGTVVYLGIPYGDVMVKRYYFEKIVRNELKVLGSWNAISAPFPGKEWITTVYNLKVGNLNFNQLISHRVPLEEGPEIFNKIINKEGSFGKVILIPEEVK